ncbi:hypothetical protein GF373_12350 [bacterium]|nr:hypothetical protein [bacterium]
MAQHQILQRTNKEALFLAYTWKSLKGRNILAVAIMTLLMLCEVFLRELGLRDTKETMQYMALELYSPMIGILLFSDLIAQEFEARRTDLLQSSAMGFLSIVLRKIIHGMVILLFTLLVSLTIWYFFYGQPIFCWLSASLYLAESILDCLDCSLPR